MNGYSISLDTIPAPIYNQEDGTTLLQAEHIHELRENFTRLQNTIDLYIERNQLFDTITAENQIEKETLKGIIQALSEKISSLEDMIQIEKIKLQEYKASSERKELASKELLKEHVKEVNRLSRRNTLSIFFSGEMYTNHAFLGGGGLRYERDKTSIRIGGGYSTDKQPFYMMGLRYDLFSIKF